MRNDRQIDMLILNISSAEIFKGDIAYGNLEQSSSQFRLRFKIKKLRITHLKGLGTLLQSERSFDTIQGLKQFLANIIWHVCWKVRWTVSLWFAMGKNANRIYAKIMELVDIPNFPTPTFGCTSKYQYKVLSNFQQAEPSIRFVATT